MKNCFASCSARSGNQEMLGFIIHCHSRDHRKKEITENKATEVEKYYPFPCLNAQESSKLLADIHPGISYFPISGMSIPPRVILPGL
jgi:hypothetical protein